MATKNPWPDVNDKDDLMAVPAAKWVTGVDWSVVEKVIASSLETLLGSHYSEALDDPLIPDLLVDGKYEVMLASLAATFASRLQLGSLEDGVVAVREATQMSAVAAGIEPNKGKDGSPTWADTALAVESCYKIAHAALALGVSA